MLIGHLATILDELVDLFEPVSDQLAIGDDAVKRCHVLVAEVAFNGVLVHRVDLLHLAEHQRSDVAYLKEYDW